jgi:hypothetical protein
MPLTPSFGDKHAGPIARVYAAAEKALWRWIGASLNGGRGSGRFWMSRMLMRLPGFRQGVHRIVDHLTDVVPGLVDAGLSQAWRDGVNAARADVPSVPVHDGGRHLRALVDQVVDTLTGTHAHIPAAAENMYRRVVDEAARDDTATNEPARRGIVRRALDRFARTGFTGFVDRRGRRYEFVSYAESTMRAAVSRAEVDAYTQALSAAGYDLFVVSDVPGSCKLCEPFEGKVISITGATAGAIARDNLSGRSVSVTVMCSLAEARERGLFHFSCRHTIKVWTPDDPAPPRAVRASEADRAAARRRRALERRERILQRRALVARSR